MKFEDLTFTKRQAEEFEQFVKEYENFVTSFEKFCDDFLESNNVTEDMDKYEITCALMAAIIGDTCDRKGMDRLNRDEYLEVAEDVSAYLEEN